MEKKKYYFGLILLLFSFSTAGEEFNYNFHWLFVPVAKLSININEVTTTESAINLLDAKFQLSTEGPLKLLRNYQSTIKKKFSQKDDM